MEPVVGLGFLAYAILSNYCSHCQDGIVICKGGNYCDRCEKRNKHQFFNSNCGQLLDYYCGRCKKGQQLIEKQNKRNNNDDCVIY